MSEGFSLPHQLLILNCLMPPILPNATVSQLFVIKVNLYFVFIYIAGVQKIEIIDFQYKFTE